MASYTVGKTDVVKPQLNKKKNNYILRKLNPQSLEINFCGGARGSHKISTILPIWASLLNMVWDNC